MTFPAAVLALVGGRPVDTSALTADEGENGGAEGHQPISAAYSIRSMRHNGPPGSYSRQTVGRPS